ncbi:hypothetical protein MUP05_07720 [Candidatus Bathyarchaeota archaeon]|nr:hypothetical protein [Candidatus Bathyarchaeota archaeon]
MTVVDVVRERLEGRDPVEFWLSRISPRARGGSKSSLVGFQRWLVSRPEWLGVDPRGLLLRQAAANDSYALLELLQKYVDSREDLCANSKAFMYNAVRSFFLHNRLPLPSDRSYRIRASKTPVVSRLTLENVVDMARNASLRDRSIILVKWQSLLDNTRTMWIGEHGAEQIVKQIQGKIHPVRLDLPGRKMGLNTRPFSTFIGKDAVDALVEYFEKECGWPKPGEPVWPKKILNAGGNGKALTYMGFDRMWIRQLRRIGLIPKQPGRSATTRYGYNPHEMRDIAKSLLHTKALTDGFDLSCCEFWLGHIVDPLGYDKFFNDQEYVKKQYLIAEKYLNIISRPGVSDEQRHQEQETVLKMRRELDEVIQRLDHLIPTKTGSDSIAT